MANSLWGKVYYQDLYAGRLQQEPGGRCSFTYDESYLGNKEAKRIAFSMPLQKASFISEAGLHPFFDNLIAEGWLSSAQARALGVNPNDRFSLLLGYGADLAGAVSVIDPEPRTPKNIDHDDATIAALTSRASLSGVQRKLFVVKEGKKYRPARAGELSTHIAKLPSANLGSIVELEFLTTLAVRTMLPDDEVVDLEIASVESVSDEALIVPRFDRTKSGGKVHFEEFNQLLGKKSGDKYNGAYEEMGQFIMNTPECIPVEADRLYRRILACLLVGNTDAHFKNFAMMHRPDGLRLTPLYDLVAGVQYEYMQIELSLGGTANLKIIDLKAKHLISMADGFGVNENAIRQVMIDFERRLDKVQSAISDSIVGTKTTRDSLTDWIGKRWNGSYASTGQLLSKKQSKGAKPKS